MIYFIGNYSIEGTENRSIEDLARVLKSSKVIGLDTETKSKGNSTLKFDILDQEVVMLQLGVGENQWVIDCRTEDLSKIKVYLESTKIKKVIHNAKFDYSVLKNDKNIVLENV